MKGVVAAVMLLSLNGAAVAEDITITGAPVYVTRNDCRALVEAHAAPDVAYTPGIDGHGKFVAPADLAPDLQNGGMPLAFPDRITFVVHVPASATGKGASPSPNSAPSEGQRQGQQGLRQTSVPLGRVVIDTATGEASFNGQPLSGPDNRVLRDACRRAGY